MSTDKTLYHMLAEKVTHCIANLQQDGVLPAALQTDAITVQPTKRPEHGDVATNCAMVLCQQVQKPPRELAVVIVRALEQEDCIEKIEIAGPGFINLFLKRTLWAQELHHLLEQGRDYGRSTVGQSIPVNVEYVSTNPTGPLHIGHCRVAVVGDVLARLFDYVGYRVTREYYINDAGAQADALARSVYTRYLEALGHETDGPAAYGGDYLIPVGHKAKELYGDRFVGREESDWLPEIRRLAIDEMMALIRADLAQLNIHQDVFTSEKALVAAGRVCDALAALREKGLVYEGVLDKPKGKEDTDWEPRQQTLFRASQFGDDSDRALKKSDGSWTYFASDIAYHFDKIARGARILINVWGADHGGYVKRITAATKALSDCEVEIHCELAQMVKFLVKGQPYKMSKRAGTFLRVQEAVDEVGLPAMRFMMLMRRTEQALDFDFDAVKQQSHDNPVFYVQYAYARAHSVKRHAATCFADLQPKSVSLDALAKLTQDAYMPLLRHLAQWPLVVKSAAQHREPHRIPYYMLEVAALFHALWNQGKQEAELRFVNLESRADTELNLALLEALVTVLSSGFELLGIEPQEIM